MAKKCVKRFDLHSMITFKCVLLPGVELVRLFKDGNRNVLLQGFDQRNHQFTQIPGKRIDQMCSFHLRISVPSVS